MNLPRYSYEAAILHELAAHLLAKRKSAYPAAITAGQMTEAEAARGILIMSDLERLHEQRKLRLEGHRPNSYNAESSPRERRDVLAKVAGATAKIAAAEPGDTRKRDYADALAAMLWHAENELAADQAIMARLAGRAA